MLSNPNLKYFHRKVVSSTVIISQNCQILHPQLNCKTCESNRRNFERSYGKQHNRYTPGYFPPCQKKSGGSEIRTNNLLIDRRIVT